MNFTEFIVQHGGVFFAGLGSAVAVLLSGIGSAAGIFLIVGSQPCQRLGLFICAVIDVTSFIIPASFQALN